MRRVWLSEWEWACCGDPFGRGDEVDFGIGSRAVPPALVGVLDPEVLATADAMESHHEEDSPDRVRGRVVAVYMVTREVVERLSLRRPGDGAPPDATRPPNGGDWPMVGRTSGEGAFWGTRPSRYVIEIVPVPGTAKLTAAQGIRQPVNDQTQQLPSTEDLAADPPSEQRRRTISGWLVDVQEQAQEVR